MPIFEYVCQKCNAEFEKIVFNQAEALCCPECGSDQLNRLLSTFAVSASKRSSPAPEPGPCPCGAAQRGMCGAIDG